MENYNHHPPPPSEAPPSSRQYVVKRSASNFVLPKRACVVAPFIVGAVRANVYKQYVGACRVWFSQGQQQRGGGGGLLILIRQGRQKILKVFGGTRRMQGRSRPNIPGGGGSTNFPTVAQQ